MSEKQYLVMLNRNELNNIRGCLDEYKLHIRGTILVEGATRAINALEEWKEATLEALDIIKAVLDGAYERGTVYTNDTDFWTVATPRQLRVTKQDKIDALSDLAKNVARANPTPTEPCAECGGSKEVPDPSRSCRGHSSMMTCPTCHGSGEAP